MEEINHVSHEEHPLMLIENAQMVVGGVDGDDDGKREIVCSWCQEPILGATYACTSCDYFMHKTCAQLEPFISYYLHLQHPLILSRHENRWFCDVCGCRAKDHATKFIYNCSLCKFSACIKCCVVAARLKDATNVKVKIEGHPDHTLALQLRLGTFRCDACQTDDKDLFYQCNDCPFWIHKTCATLAPNIHLPRHHHHPLLLTYGLPERFYNFEYKCKFCKETILGSLWLYHCANCRYFAHIKCALHAPLTPRDGLGATSNAEEQANDHDILHFPMSEAFTDPLKLLYLEKTTPDDDNAAEIIHWSHHHPLMLIVKPQGNIMLDIDRGDPIIVCHGCVRPLTLPYYSCKDGCGFFLHKYCAELPRTLHHKLHKDHSLDLVDVQDSTSKTYNCSGCFIDGNTFVYKCEPCNFYLDVNCAFLPNTIKHQFHKQHPLVQGINRRYLCNACNGRSFGISYFCEACDFKLHMLCALESPYSLAHRYCKGHEVPLTYPPVEDHIEDFYCTICEEEMNPNFWLYHCNKCDNSFHARCIRNRDWYGNCQLEGIVTVSYHKHPLTLVRRKKTPRYVCFGCNHDVNGHLILECRTGTCPFRICIRCHLKNEGRKHL